jgi:hypothetical protein
MDYTYYDSDTHKWVTIPEAEKDQYKEAMPVPVNADTKSIFRGIGVRKVNGALEALPFRVKDKTFTNIHAAEAYKDQNKLEDEIQVRVFNGKDSKSVGYPFIPVSEVFKRKNDGEDVRTEGFLHDDIPVTGSRDEYISQQVKQKVKEGGFGAADTLKVLGTNVLKGVSPVAELVEMNPDIRNLMETHRAYSNVEKDEDGNPYNADPGYFRTIGETILPQALGAVSPWGLSRLAQKVGPRVGGAAAKILDNKVSQTVFNPTSSAIDLGGYAASKAAPTLSKVLPRTTGALKTASEIPTVRKLGMAAAPVFKSSMSAVGDTILSDAVGDTARDEKISIDPLSTGISAGLGAVPGLFGVRPGWKAGQALNEIHTANQLRAKMDERWKSDPNTAQILDEGVESVERASQIDLPGDTPVPKDGGFNGEGTHLPSAIEARLKKYETSSEVPATEALKVAGEGIPQLQKGLRETLPEYTAAGSAAQKAAFSRVPDRYGIESSYPSAQKAIDELHEDLGNRIYEGPDPQNPRATGKTLPEARDEARNLLEAEGLVRSNPEISPAQQAVNTANRGVTPSFTSTNPSKMVMSSAPNSVVNMPPSPLVPPVASAPAGNAVYFPSTVPPAPARQPAPTVFDALSDETPLTGGGPAPAAPQDFQSRLAAKMAERQLKKQQSQPTVFDDLGAEGPLPSPARKKPPRPTTMDQLSNDAPIEGGGAAPAAPVAPQAAMQVPSMVTSRPGSTWGTPQTNSFAVNTSGASPNVSSYPMANTKGYNVDADIVPYEKMHALHQRKNVDWGNLQTANKTAYDKATIDASRISTREVLSRAFGNDFKVPQEAKHVALAVEDALKKGLAINPDTPASAISLDVARDAPLIINLIKAMEAMKKNSVTPTNPNSLSRPSVELDAAAQGVSDIGLTGLARGIDVRGAVNKPSLAPALAMHRFNNELKTYLGDVATLLKKSETMKTDKAFVELNDIVKTKWPILEQLIKDVGINDLNPMGKLMREYVIWNSFVGNIPVLGPIGKGMGSLQMLIHGFSSILQQDSVHVASSSLDQLVIAKNADKLEKRILEGVKAMQSQFEKGVKLRGFRQIGRTATSGIDNKYEGQKKDLSGDSLALFDALEKAAQESADQIKENNPVTEPTQSDKVSEAFQRLVDAPEDQQEALYDSFMTNGTLTPEEISQLDAMIAGEQ